MKGRGPGGPLFLGQTEAQRAENNFFETAPSSESLDPPLQTVDIKRAP